MYKVETGIKTDVLSWDRYKGWVAAKGHFLWRHQRFSSLERSPFALQCYQGYLKPVIAGPEVQRRFIGRLQQKR